MCPYHDWSDDDFDFNGLYKAEAWIEKFYSRSTGLRMMTKEKYGTIRYEYTHLWCKNKKHALKWFEIARRATVRFPEYAGEIISDIVPLINVVDKPTAYYKGYFEAVLWIKHKSKWESF